jgi:putative thioredoxin
VNSEAIAVAMIAITMTNATEASFQTDVIERSFEHPVVVDFWAEWCGPCRQLGPLLEREVEQRSDSIELVKVDTDANQQLARDYQIQGIPAVKAFKDGKVVDEFVGAQPPQAVIRFLDGLVPSAADGLVGQGDEASLRQALALEPTRADAAMPLAKLLYARGDTDEVLEILARVPGSFAADGLTARIGLERAAADTAATTPGTATATLPLTDAFAALNADETERGLDILLNLLPESGDAKDEIRKVIVGVLDELGPQSDLARAARRRLATALY